MIHSKQWLAAGLLALAMLGFIALGCWQLERAELNRALAESFARAEELPVIERVVSAREAAQLRYRRIRLRGHYELETQLLLDNMTYRGRAGYQVLTPFRVAGGGLVLVNRGWVPASPDRSVLPELALAGRAATVRGRIDDLPRAALELGTPVPAGGSRRVVLSFPDFEDAAAVLGEEVAAFQLLLDPDAEDGFVRAWAPAGDRADRNIAYAVQWFGLALLALGLAIGLGLRRLRHGRRQP